MINYPIIEQGAPLNEASKALILLHGRGGTAQNILQLASEFCDERFYIAAPQAPNHTWYPYSFLEEERLNEPWLSSSIEAVKLLIDQIAQYIAKPQITLMGFSQGACLALEVASRYAAKYGGVVAFTGGLIGKTLNKKKYSGNFEGTKVFIGNSDRDSHVPLVRSEQSKIIMEKIGADVTLKIYKGMGHTINEEEIAWVKTFIMIT
jgi:phospholipase/carboxylesterase